MRTYSNKTDSSPNSIYYTLGRIVLNVWRRMRAEMKLQSNERTYVAEELLNRRFPYFTQEQLIRWFKW